MVQDVNYKAASHYEPPITISLNMLNDNLSKVADRKTMKEGPAR
jgi:hypothetical protein